MWEPAAGGLQSWKSPPNIYVYSFGWLKGKMADPQTTASTPWP